MDHTVDLQTMLAARDRRAERQRELLGKFGLPMISFTMNIAGPVKNNPLIRRGFQLGRRVLLGQLERMKFDCVFREEWDETTGCEGFFVADAPAEVLKDMTCALEDASPLGRLFDLDVLAVDGTKLDRPAPRRCLICGKPAKECARSRTHSVPELQEKTRDILETALKKFDAETAARLAVQALLYEVCVTPKPGLVDRVNNGSHSDMDIYTFLRSAAALWPYFAQCAEIGRDTAERTAPETFAALRWPGKLAEGDMIAATGGVNTHKGAIFSMGILCGALGRLERECWTQPERVLAEVSAMTAGSAERELAAEVGDAQLTAGQRFFREYGITGVRGQAEAGFPAVLRFGLPVLERGLEQGRSADEVGCAALLAILAHMDDTNMISRGGFEAQQEMAGRLEKLLDAEPFPERETLDALDREFIENNLSPGGSADLLAVSWMLHFLREEEV